MSKLEFSLTFGIPASILYETLTNPQKLSAVTRCPAVFNNQAGGVFNYFNGRIQGENVELKENEEITQKWKMSDWADFSQVKMTFDEISDDEVELIIEQTGLPSSTHPNQMRDGWMGMIFEPLSGILGYPITQRDF